MTGKQASLQWERKGVMQSSWFSYFLCLCLPRVLTTALSFRRRGREAEARAWWLTGKGQWELTWLFTSALARAYRGLSPEWGSTVSSEVPIVEPAFPWRGHPAGKAVVSSPGALRDRIYTHPRSVLSCRAHLVSWQYACWAEPVTVHWLPNCCL